MVFNLYFGVENIPWVSRFGSIIADSLWMRCGMRCNLKIQCYLCSYLLCHVIKSYGFGEGIHIGRKCYGTKIVGIYVAKCLLFLCLVGCEEEGFMGPHLGILVEVILYFLPRQCNLGAIKK